jgi:hypothetical protein
MERSERGGGEGDLRRAQTLAASFACDNRCVTCLIQPLRGRTAPLSMEVMRAAIDENGARRRYDRLVLSGAEVTLDRRLLEIAEYARKSGSYRHIRIQTNGRRLADRAYLQACMAAGIDEYYVSVRAHDAALDARITGDPASFGETVAGLRNLADADAFVVTNTPAFAWNVEELGAIAKLALGFRPARVEFYGFVPVAEGQRCLAVPVQRLASHVVEALTMVEDAGVGAGAAWVPQCLLGDLGHCFAPALPETVIAPEFWTSFPDFACFYAAVCGNHPGCQGIPLPIIEAHGWATEALRPVPRPPGRRSGSKGGGAYRTFEAAAWLDLLTGTDGKVLTDWSYWRVGTVRPLQRRTELDFALPEGFELRVALAPKSDRGGGLQTNSFDVAISPIGRPPPRALSARFATTLLAVLTRNDDGRLAFDGP